MQFMLHGSAQLGVGANNVTSRVGVPGEEQPLPAV